MLLDLPDSIERLPEVPALRHRVHETLESLIINRTIRPGAKLVEGDLAATLGVSRGPVREALQQLAQDGFVELRPRQGAFVHVPTVKEIDNFYDVRRMLEVEAVRLAALHITPQGIAALRACLKRGNAMLARGENPSTIVPGPHDIIAAIANNQVLTQFLALINKRSAWYLSPFEVKRKTRAWQEHALIVEAVAQGDAAAAASAMQAHIDGSRAVYKELEVGLAEPAL